MKAHTHILVLWGNRFDEVAATIFVTELRKGGLPVKLMGMYCGQARGAYGLALVPDISLDQAQDLLPQVRCLIIPAPLHSLQQYRNDPRLHAFLHQLLENQGQIIVQDGDLEALEGFAARLFTGERVRTYPLGAALLDFARDLALDLQAVS